MADDPIRNQDNAPVKGCRSFNDLVVGIILILTGLVGFWLTSDLRMGTAMRMGPGYIPFGLCIILVGLGALCCVRAFLVDGERPEPWPLRQPVIISLSIAFFAFAIERLGLVPAIFGLVVIGSLASAETRRLESIILGAALALLSVAIFVYALRLPMQLWPAGWY